MKKFIGILMMLFSFSVVWAESMPWIELGTSQDKKVIFSPKTRQVGIYTAVWMKTEYLHNSPIVLSVKKGHSVMTLQHINCNAYTIGSTHLVHYNSRGEILENIPFNTPQRPIIPDSYEDFIANLVCRKS